MTAPRADDREAGIAALAALHFPDGQCDVVRCSYVGSPHDHAWPNAQLRVAHKVRDAIPSDWTPPDLGSIAPDHPARSEWGMAAMQEIDRLRGMIGVRDAIPAEPLDVERLTDWLEDALVIVTRPQLFPGDRGAQPWRARTARALAVEVVRLASLPDAIPAEPLDVESGHAPWLAYCCKDHMGLGEPDIDIDILEKAYLRVINKRPVQVEVMYFTKGVPVESQRRFFLEDIVRQYTELRNG